MFYAHDILSDGAITHPLLRDELLAMESIDQEYRLPGNEDQSRASVVSLKNTGRLKAIIEDHGWPRISMVGEDGAQAAWLIVQHADQDRGFQNEVLAMMEPLVKTGEVSLESYAYLYDRVNDPQRYGTQGSCVSKGIWEPRQIEGRAQVDERRAEVGMQTLQEYMNVVARLLCVD